MRHKKVVYCIFPLMVLIGVMAVGAILDSEADRVIQQLYQRDESGVIQGGGGFEKVHGNNTAMVLMHGFLETPTIYSGLIKHHYADANLDLYVPLLPSHGRSLQAAQKLNNQEVKAFILEKIIKISSNYETVIAVGYSYSGAILAALANEKALPDNVNVILLAPGLFIVNNTLAQRIKLFFYSLFRNYCNYPSLGCGFPVFESGDEKARDYLIKEISLRYKVIPAVKQLLEMDNNNRQAIQRIKRPFLLIVAKDDNRVSFERLKKACARNSCCHFHAFPSGKHILQYSKHSKQLGTLLFIKSAALNLRCQHQ